MGVELMERDQRVLVGEVLCLGCGETVPHALADEISADVKDVHRWNDDGGLFFDLCPCVFHKTLAVTAVTA
jgi:hypothetical protein